MRVILSNNQTRVKDCWASSQLINLTLRSNGEEKPQVIDSLGALAPAGIDAPIAAPTATMLAGDGLASGKYYSYRYVYVAKKRYPLVQNAVTGGGSQAPRGNPSPKTILYINPNFGGYRAVVTIPMSTRSDIDAIWLYRTDAFDTSDEAGNAAESGQIFWLAEIYNFTTGGNITYTDSSPTVTGNEGIELNNFVAPQFQLCVYSNPYFYGFGNFEFTDSVSVQANGIVTLTSETSKWFDGRNSQITTLEGVTNGGFDGAGSYYFKYLTGTTAQLCNDLQLLQTSTVTSTGITQIKIRGQSTTLYRSKPNNPISWGEDVFEGTTPAPFILPVGGGNGVAMSIITTSNLLKLDTEAPTRSYVFNLRQQGLEGFAETKRIVSSTVAATNHWAQFESIGSTSSSLQFFLDTRNHCIAKTDGINFEIISDKVFATLRDMDSGFDSRLFSHGAYDTRTETANFWFASNGSPTTVNKCLTLHVPTGSWSYRLAFGVLCSTQVLDTSTNELKTIVGMDSGLVGHQYNPDTLIEWDDAEISALLAEAG